MKSERQRKFYASKAWTDCRKAYRESVGGLCEQCLKRGIVTPGEIVHHKIHIDDKTLDNPNVLLNWDNLELLCRKCHGIEHMKKRWKVDKDGRVIAMR